MKILFEELIPETYRKDFITRVVNISKMLGISPDSLMLTMYIETNKTFSASVQNPKSKATGLIQFMPATAKALGITIEELQAMTPTVQLTYVYEYLKPYAGKMKDFTDTYLAVFFPAAIGKPDDWVLETKSLSAEKIASWNPLFDLNKDGKIQKGEITKKIMSYIPKQ